MTLTLPGRPALIDMAWPAILHAHARLRSGYDFGSTSGLPVYLRVPSSHACWQDRTCLTVNSLASRPPRWHMGLACPGCMLDSVRARAGSGCSWPCLNTSPVLPSLHCPGVCACVIIVRIHARHGAYSRICAHGCCAAHPSVCPAACPDTGARRGSLPDIESVFMPLNCTCMPSCL